MEKILEGDISDKGKLISGTQNNGVPNIDVAPFSLIQFVEYAEFVKYFENPKSQIIG